MSRSKLCRSRSGVAIEAVSLSKQCRCRSLVALDVVQLRSFAQKPCHPAPSDGASCNNSSPLARRPLTQPRSSPSDQHIASRTQAVDSARVPNRKFASKKKGHYGIPSTSCTTIGASAISSHASSSRVHRLMPHASSVSKLQNAHKMRSRVDCVQNVSLVA